MAEHRTKFRTSPFCGRLRAKKLFVEPSPPMDVSDVLDASNACWCGRTMAALGPDGRIVHPDDCQAQRACYEPWGPRPPRA